MTRPRCSTGLKEIRATCHSLAPVVLRGHSPTDAEGTQETVKPNHLFYWPPGHNVKVDADAEIIMFSPQHEHSHVIDHMIKKVNG